MKLVKLYIRVVDRLSVAIGLAMSVLVPAMMLVIAYEVALRYFFRHPTVWVFDTAIFMFGYIGLLAGAYVLKDRQHISIDIVHSRLSPRGKAILDSVTQPIVLFFLGLVIWHGSDFAWANLGQHRSTEWAPPLGHLLVMIPLGAFLLLLQAVANWIRDIHLAVTSRVLDV